MTLIRFNKGSKQTLRWPMKTVPNGPDKLASPVRGNKLLAASVPVPLHPEDKGFNEQLYEVLRIRDDVMAGEWPAWALEQNDIDPEPPDFLLRAFSMPESEVPLGIQAAEMVHMDKPTDLGMAMLDQIHRWDCPVKGVNDKHVRFMEGVVDVISDLGSSIAKGLAETWGIKWYYGRARPEEVVGYNCTEYEEGCPTHPSYPAGHGRAAKETLECMRRRFKLETWQERELETGAKHFATYRSFAGVHYLDDNLVHFND